MADKTATRSTNRAPRKSRTRVSTAPQMYTAEQVAGIVAQAASSAALAMAGISGGVSTIGSVSAPDANTNVRDISTARKRTSTASTGTGKPGRKPQPNSGLSRARALFAEMSANQQNSAESFRKTVVTAFKEKLKLKPDIANTYYHVIAGKKSGGTSRGRRKKATPATDASQAQAATG